MLGVRMILALLVSSCGLPGICAAEADPRFASLPRLQLSQHQQPLRIDEEGGLELVWWELWEGPLLELTDPNLRATLYYRRVASDGRVLVDKKQLTTFRRAAHTSVLTEGSGHLLVTWTLRHSDDLLHWLVVDNEGQVGEGPDTAPGLQDYLLVPNSEGAIYGVGLPNTRGLLAGYDLYAVRVYPKPEGQLVSLFDGPKQNRFGARISPSFAATMTSDDNILLCARPSSPHSGRSKWKHDEVICVVVDLSGQIVWGPRKLELHRDAFRVIPGAYLGGWTIENTKEIGGGIDLTTVQGDQIVLSLTSWDPEGRLCICQAKFSGEGRFMAPDSMEAVRARKIVPADRSVRAKVEGYQMFKEVGMFDRSQLCIYGFDEDGNFYWDTEPWVGGD